MRSSTKKMNRLCVFSLWGDSSNVRNMLSKTDCISSDRLLSVWERQTSENGSNYPITFPFIRFTEEHSSSP